MSYTSMANNWPECFNGDGRLIGNNQSLVFTPNPALAVESNANTRNQKCEQSFNQLLYLTVYSDESSTESKPHEGEFPDTKSTADLLNCVQDVKNRVIQTKSERQEIMLTRTEKYSKIVKQELALVSKLLNPDLAVSSTAS